MTLLGATKDLPVSVPQNLVHATSTRIKRVRAFSQICLLDQSPDAFEDEGVGGSQGQTISFDIWVAVRGFSCTATNLYHGNQALGS